MDLDKKYIFPIDLTPVQHNGYILLISPSNGSWVVLENQLQVDIIKKLIAGQDVKELLCEYANHNDDFLAVIKEIEGRHFCESFLQKDSGFTLRVYLTNRCNLRCKHCFMYSAKSLDNELSYDEIVELLDESASAGCRKLILTGGEVLLRPRFMDIASHAHGLGMYIQVLTNGVLWNEESIERASHIVDEIQVSIDGFDEVTNAEMRGKGAFARSIETVEKFLATKRVFVSVSMNPLFQYISKYKNEYIRFAKEMVNRYRNDDFLMIFGREILDGRSVKSKSEENSIISSIVDEIYESIYPNAELTTFVNNHRNNRVYEGCGYGGLTVNSNGDIYFCGRVNEVICHGNIRKIDYKKIFELRREVRSRSSICNIIPCNECDVRLICGGGCRISCVPDMTRTNILLSEKPLVFSRNCSLDFKKNIYKLMIESSEHLYF